VVLELGHRAQRRHGRPGDDQVVVEARVGRVGRAGHRQEHGAKLHRSPQVEDGSVHWSDLHCTGWACPALPCFPALSCLAPCPALPCPLPCPPALPPCPAPLPCTPALPCPAPCHALPLAPTWQWTPCCAHSQESGWQAPVQEHPHFSLLSRSESCKEKIIQETLRQD
jgi:hypothetical protein